MCPEYKKNLHKWFTVYPIEIWCKINNSETKYTLSLSLKLNKQIKKQKIHSAYYISLLQ